MQSNDDLSLTYAFYAYIEQENPPQTLIKGE